MRAPLLWLADYVDLPDSIDELANRLTLSGTEIEEVIRVGENWQDIIVGHVIKLERPAGSRTLNVATLDVGRESIIAVTAAPNISVGQKVPVVRIGGTVPWGPEGHPVVLQPKSMMGITGDAMVLSARELTLSDEHAGIMVLPKESTAGTLLSELMGGSILDAAITANRPDEMSMVGIAREIAAMTERPLREPDLSEPQHVELLPNAVIGVSVRDTDLCPRYTALRIEGVRVGPSPEWMRTRLEAAGVRSINNVVDVSNFVMLELGQPLHAFDQRFIDGEEIVVRRAEPGETLVTLDGVERSLTSDVLLIADSFKPLAIAGLMGGEHSEVSEDTTSLLLESANFDRVNIRLSSRRLGLRTEASARFERGVPPELTIRAVARFVHLLAEVNPEPISIGIMADVATVIAPLPSIPLTAGAFKRLLGMDISLAEAANQLRTLGFDCDESLNELSVTPPFWRRDVEGVADICEEVARSIGYDRIPESLPGQETPPAPAPPDLTNEQRIRDILWGLNLSEAWTDTLTSVESLARLVAEATQGSRSELPEESWMQVVANLSAIVHRGASATPLALVKPPSAERSILRTTMVPSLLDVVARNLKHTRERVAFFEISRTFFGRPGDLPYERRTLSLALSGDSEPRTWTRPARPYDFFDLKGLVTETLTQLGVDESRLVYAIDGLPAWLHPGRAATMRIDNDPFGWLGEVHPHTAQRFGIESPTRAYVAEIDLDTIFARMAGTTAMVGLSKFPSVRRDISIALGIDTPAVQVRDIVVATGGSLLKDVRVVDVYHGENLGQDRKSLMLGLEFQSDSETLTQDRVSEIQDSIVAALHERVGGELRS